MPDLSIIIPTFNERENIRDLITSIRRTLDFHCISGEILVVDDNSPDGTAEAARYCGANVLVRTTDKGLSQSVVDGFAHASSDILLVMDADGSHPTKCIYKLYVEILNGADVSIASRYVHGGSIKHWPFVRRVTSRGATVLARILFPDITDPVSGFFALRKDILTDVQLRPSGYKILTEILGKCNYKEIREISYTFTNRSKGDSKMGLQQIFEYVVQLFDIFAYALTHRGGKVWNEIVRATRFAVVGISGIFVNLLALYILVEGFNIHVIISGFIAVELSILSNFLFNDRWTFVDKHDKKIVTRLYSFHAVSFIGMLIQIAVLGILTQVGVWYMLASLIGIFVAFAWNFIANRQKTWI